MTAKEFIEKEALEYKLAEYDEGGFLGINERLLEQKLEEYHQAKLKLLGIGVVGGSFLYELKTIAYGKGSSSERLEEIKEKLSSK